MIVGDAAMEIGRSSNAVDSFNFSAAMLVLHIAYFLPRKGSFVANISRFLSTSCVRVLTRRWPSWKASISSEST